MKRDIHRRIAKFISSQQTASSEIQKRIINLGKTLVKEISSDQRVDTPTRWMVHYIAEQMTIAENKTGDDKIEAEQNCFETILKLWQHRSSLSIKLRPFENFKPIFRVLERLDPENERPFNFKIEKLIEPDKKINLNESVQKWLDIALDIDQVARIWLDYVFEQAALCATDENTKAWLENSVGLRDNDDIQIIARLLPDNFLSSDEVSPESIKQEKIESINDKIKKLEAFSDFNQNLLSILRKELEDISKEDSSTDEDDLK